MKNFISIISTIVVTFMIILSVNFVSFGERALTDQENAAFITREEFQIWSKGFEASLSEIDRVSTAKIYKDMDFYDMIYRFTSRYKNPFDEDEEPEDYAAYEAEMEIKIREERAKRGLL